MNYQSYKMLPRGKNEKNGDFQENHFRSIAGEAE